MTLSRDQLIERLLSAEWTDLEVKEASWAVPRSALETVSAFANSSGGHLVFGVKEENRAYEVIGVIDVDKVQGDLLSQLNSRDKISCQLAIKEDLLKIDDKHVLVFFIGEAERQRKPVHLDRDIRKSFIRRGGGDQRCSEEDVRRFLRAADGQRYESEIVDFDLTTAIDTPTLSRYRHRFQTRDPANSCNNFDDAHFLEHWALAAHVEGRLRPTRAAILLFGTGPALRTMMPRPIVDCRWATHEWGSPSPEQRWVDRLLCEENLWICWEQLATRYVQNATKPFAIEMKTMERQDRPEDFVSFREAAINLLMHQDFEETTRSAMLAFHPDRVVFENPGVALANKAELLEPGAKDVRNPLIVSMFRRVGLSEQAGTGIGAIFRDWRNRGRVPPEIVNDLGSYSFRLSLLAKELMSERQLLFQASLGARLSDAEANALAILCGQPQVSLSEFRASLGIGSAEVMAVLERLQTQVLAKKIERQEGVRYELAEQLRERWPLDGAPKAAQTSLVTDQPPVGPSNLVTDQVADSADGSKRVLRAVDTLSEAQRVLLAACDTPRRLAELMELLGVTHRANFTRLHLKPLLDGGLLQPQYPDNPNHPRQRYSITEVGAKIVAKQIKDEEKADGQER
ncbi:putative DNA binding domain-containing protein [Mesorhizobium sp. M0664]|uniref:RNA-binding domain-containing protein n=1 Tax=Mesorhizobium sp. M0664 TaxID=2956982 RepID=UPI00333988ED